MTPDDILEDMANELILEKYDTIKESKRKFSLLKELTLWIQKFHPKHNSLKDLVSSCDEK